MSHVLSFSLSNLTTPQTHITHQGQPASPPLARQTLEIPNYYWLPPTGLITRTTITDLQKNFHRTRYIMEPQTAPPSPPSSNLPPLLALPLELKLQILSSFSDYAGDPDHALALMILRRTHKSLRDIIPNPWKSAKPAKEHFLAAERKHPYLFPSLTDYPEPLAYPCYLLYESSR